MKSSIKVIMLIIVMMLLIIYPLNIGALNNETSYVSIRDTKEIEIGDLSFSGIVFKDYSLTSIKGFGLGGNVLNKSNKTIVYSSIVYFYDKDYNFIGQSDKLIGMAITGTNKFNQMSQIDILNSHDIKEVAYYNLSIMIDENLVLSSSDLTPSRNTNYLSNDYVIDKYDINIKVNENHSFDITETITAYFNIEKHGIYKTIFSKNTITKLDGTTLTNKAKISNINVDSEYTTSRKNGDYVLQIGSSDNTIIGEKNYVIKYTYSLENDQIKEYDELYYNIIGTEWDTAIGNITFTIIMPKDFDSNKLSFVNTDISKVKYTVSDNKIIGSYEGILEKNEGLSIRCELDEGYFVNKKNNISLSDYILFLILIISLIIIIFFGNIFRKNNKVFLKK